MTIFSEELREAVAARAGQRCEYCHLPTRGQVATFPIDHILPRSSGGETILDNLALACPHCNAFKWAHATGMDPLSGATVSLFHPRCQLWEDHFHWSAQEIGVLEGKTPCGRATISQLHINDTDMVDIRQLLATSVCSQKSTRRKADVHRSGSAKFTLSPFAPLTTGGFETRPFLPFLLPFFLFPLPFSPFVVLGRPRSIGIRLTVA